MLRRGRPLKRDPADGFGTSITVLLPLCSDSDTYLLLWFLIAGGLLGI